MTRVSVVAAGVVVLSASLAAAQGAAVTGTAQAAPPPPMTNLQIIPKDTPRPQVLATMQAFTQSLGVQCNYCHVFEGRGGRNDMASDEKPAKKAARGMMLLAREINTKLPDAIGKPADATTRVGCATCHRGVPIPKQIADIVTEAGNSGGAAAGLARFQGSTNAVLRRPELRLQ
jgi:photosynthetic reaction center cytochrome c subunit